MLYTWMDISTEPLATDFPSGENDKQFTKCEWPVIVAVTSPLLTSQRQTVFQEKKLVSQNKWIDIFKLKMQWRWHYIPVLSHEEEAITELSAENAHPLTQSPCPSKVLMAFPVAVFHNIKFLSWEALTRSSPVDEKAQSYILGSENFFQNSTHFDDFGMSFQCCFLC